MDSENVNSDLDKAQVGVLPLGGHFLPCSTVIPQFLSQFISAFPPLVSIYSPL